MSVKNPTIPTAKTEKHQFYMEAISHIAPLLRKCAVENEQIGTLSQPVVAALQNSGILRLKLAEELGGAEADPILQMELLEGLAYHDLTAAWVTMVGATGISVLGAYLPDAGISQIFANGIPRASVMPAPTAQAEAFAGGYRITGRWRFNSGIKHSEWAAVGALATEADGTKQPIIMGLDVSKATVHDNWDVVALQGTGSCDLSVDNLFISSDLTNPWSFTDPEPLRGGPLYTLPWAAYVSNEHACVVIGAAQRALDDLIAEATTTRSQYRQSGLDSRHVVHHFIGEAQLKVDAARALLYSRYRDLWAAVQGGHKLTETEINQLRSLGTYCTEIAVAVVTQVFRYGGGKALFRPNIFERLLRDVNAAGQHFAVSDQAVEDYGRSLLGL